MSDLRKINIDGTEVEVDGAMTLIQACEEAGVETPVVFAITSACRLPAIAACVW